jgi:hypothetical protein
VFWRLLSLEWLRLLIKSLSVSGESGYRRAAGGPHRGVAPVNRADVTDRSSPLLCLLEYHAKCFKRTASRRCQYVDYIASNGGTIDE